MTHNKRSKLSRARGSWTHGGGSKKKRRGAGHRGGRGRAGSGKKGDAKKPRYWKEKAPKGFVSLNKKVKTINLSQLELILTKTKETKINLADKKINKLLGAGNISKKIEITVQSASEKAIAKVEKAGGKVILPKAEAPKPAKVEKKTSDKVEDSEAPKKEAKVEEKPKEKKPEPKTDAENN